MSSPRDWLGEPRERPLVIAHRGASEHAPDNSLAAFELAARAGADLWEVDVRTSGDGALLACHDPVLPTRDGGRLAVAECGARELRARALVQGAAPVAFDEVLALAVERGAGVYVDAKDRAAAERAAGRLRAHGVARGVIASFASGTIRALAERDDTGYPRAIFVPRGRDPFALAAASGADIVHLVWRADARASARAIVTDALLGRAEALGLAVVLWHEERPALIAEMMTLPVLGVLSNDPILLAERDPPDGGTP